MQVALTGEGPTDYGRKGYGTQMWEEGPVQKYIRNIVTLLLDEKVEFVPIDKHELMEYRQQRNSKGLEGRALPARRFATWMKAQGIKKGVFYCDADKTAKTRNTESEAIKQFEKVHKEVMQGLEGTEAIPMVPLRMIESWLLGDKNALETAYAISITDQRMPNKPELLWGDKDDPCSNYPKHVLKRLIAGADKRYINYEGNREDFCEIAELSDVDTMKRTCFVSYKRFHDDLVEMIAKKEQEEL